MQAQTKKLLQQTGLIDKLLTESRDSLAEKLGEKLEERLLAATANGIPEDKIKEFEAKLANKDENVEQYLKDNVPDYQNVLQETVKTFVADVNKIL